MPKNLEVKAKIQSIEAAESMACSLQAKFICKMKQVDTYFNVNQGRLKLREIDDKEAELIFYHRPESENQRMSDFKVIHLVEWQELKEALTLSLGVKERVEKYRTLFMFDSTRIHFDEVTGLGMFIEFEVPVSDSPEQAKRTMNYLVQSFRIKDEDYFKHSYSDLLLERR
ncbi:MAG: class IV adenylate cyclase [Ignavibacteriae bacterium]|nr:class IV adenylate cyclase [Ignavibacteriota bacterium]